MSRPARFRVTRTSAGRWLVNVTSRHSESGKREQRFFPTREKAQEFAASLRKSAEDHGAKAGSLSPILAEQAVAASELIKPFGVNLLEVARRFVASEQERLASVAVASACDAYQQSKHDPSDRYASAISYACQRITEDFPNTLISEITREQLEAHIEDRTEGGGHSFNSKRRMLVSLWRWASEEPRSWCRAKVAESIPTKKVSSKEISVLTSKEAEAIMRSAEQNQPDAVPAVAISLFTGMRAAELERLKASDVSAEGITVPASSAKTKRRRFIEMTPQLQAWLDAYPISGEMVIPSSWKAKFACVRRLAGWKVWTHLVTPHNAPENLPAWQQNVLRHTHASASLACGASLEGLTFSFGHTGGAAMLRQHYAGAISRKEAMAIFAIGPNGTAIAALFVV